MKGTGNPLLGACLALYVQLGPHPPGTPLRVLCVTKATPSHFSHQFFEPLPSLIALKPHVRHACRLPSLMLLGGNMQEDKWDSEAIWQDQRPPPLPTEELRALIERQPLHWVAGMEVWQSE